MQLFAPLRSLEGCCLLLISCNFVILQVRAPPEAPPRHDDTSDVKKNLANKKINAFSGFGHGFYFWNFRTDIYEPSWSYTLALELGWIPKGNLREEQIVNACEREDSSEITCVAKKKAPEKNIKTALSYIYEVEKKNGTAEAKAVANMTGHELHEVADREISGFFQKYRHTGATCDFGGVGMLVETSKADKNSEDDYFVITDDEYFTSGGRPRYHGPKIWIIVVCVAAGTFVLTAAGFVIAMRTSKTFNQKVRAAPAFRRISHSHNSLLRLAFDLPDEYEQIGETHQEAVKF